MLLYGKKVVIYNYSSKEKKDVKMNMFDAICERYQGLPILIINEYHEAQDEPRTFIIDSNILSQYDDFQSAYIRGILAAISNGRTSVNTSLKYSFSDTPYWWEEAILPEIPNGRQVVGIDVDVSY